MSAVVVEKCGSSHRIQNAPSTFERVMSSEDYSFFKKSICKALRLKTDLPPTIVKPGKNSVRAHMQCTKNRIEELNHATRVAVPMRGWKLNTIAASSVERIAWRAEFTILVRRLDLETATRPCYECVSNNFYDEDSGVSFLFVPSSIAHPEILDEDLFNHDWQSGVVFGGDEAYVEAILKRFVGRIPCGRDAREVEAWQSYTPDRGIMTDHFEEYCSSRFPGERPVDIARRLALPHAPDAKSKYKSPSEDMREEVRNAGRDAFSSLRRITWQRFLLALDALQDKDEKSEKDLVCKQSTFEVLDSHVKTLKELDKDTCAAVSVGCNQNLAFGAMFQ